MRSLVDIVLRRSIGWIAALSALATFSASFFGRDLAVLHEMFWSVYNYNFGSVLVTPIAAGFGSWEGVRLSRLRPLAYARGAQRRALIAAWLALSTWLACAFLLGLNGVILAVRASGTPGWIEPSELIVVGPVLAQLTLGAAIGLAVGWVNGKWIAVGMVPPIIFAAILLGYGVNTNLVQVGGATAATTTLTISPAVAITQSVVFALAALVLVLTVTTPGRTALFALAIALGIVVGGIRLLWAADGPLVGHDPDLACAGSLPEVCLTREYERYRDELTVAADSFMNDLQGVGAPPIQRLTQTFRVDEVGVGVIPQLHDFSRAPELVVPSAVVNAYIGPCDFLASDSVYADVVTMVQWIDDSYDRLQQGLRVEHNSAAIDAIESIRRCDDP